MSTHTSPIARYLAQYASKLADHYKWRLREKQALRDVGITPTGANAFEKTLDLKSKLQALYWQAHGIGDATQAFEAKLKLARFYVKVWGGIGRLSEEGLREIVTMMEPLAGSKARPARQFPFQNVSSWSKWLSLLCPTWAAIYDARVAYSLNAIHFIEGVDHKVFPVPLGRNTTMGLLDAATLQLSAQLQRHGGVSAADIETQQVIPEASVYSTYLEALTSAHQELWPQKPLEYTEMLLFALADKGIFTGLAKTVGGARSADRSAAAA